MINARGVGRTSFTISNDKKFYPEGRGIMQKPVAFCTNEKS